MVVVSVVHVIANMANILIRKEMIADMGILVTVIKVLFLICGCGFMGMAIFPEDDELHRAGGFTVGLSIINALIIWG